MPRLCQIHRILGVFASAQALRQHGVLVLQRLQRQRPRGVQGSDSRVAKTLTSSSTS
jgi:hypothetical protein